MSIEYEQVEEYGLVILEIRRALAIIEGMANIRDAIHEANFHMPADEIKRLRNEAIEKADNIYMDVYSDPSFKEANTEFLNELLANE